MNSIKCPGCGLVNFASASSCKRCGGSLATPESSSLQSEQSYAEFQKGIDDEKRIIYLVGFIGTTVLSLGAAFLSEDTLVMMVLFTGILTVGYIGTWVAGAQVDARVAAERKDFVYTITPAQRAAVITSSLAMAGVCLRTEYGFILAPLVLVIINGGMYAYERELRAKRAARRD